MTEILASLPIDPAVLCMLLVCSVACVTDLRHRRIPNWLVAIGLLSTLVLQYQSWGFFGLETALIGLASAFVVTLPLLLIKAIAAGDSKLMLVVGSAIGATDMLIVLAVSMVFSGAIALVMLSVTRRFAHFGNNLSIAFMSAFAGNLDGLRDVSIKTAYQIPFACAVLMANLVWLFWIY